MFNRIRQWEPWLLPYIPQSGDIAIDVGAAQGKWALDLSERFNFVMAIEPNPISFKVLEEAVGRAHPTARITIIHGAVAHANGAKAIHLFEEPDHTSFFKEGQGVEAWRSKDLDQMFMARTFTLDTLVLEDEHFMGEVDFVKVDTEGAENLVLTGAPDMVSKAKPTWLVEYHSADNLWFCKNLLDVAGYKTQIIAHPNMDVKGHGWISARP